MADLKLLSTPFAQNGLKNNIPNNDIGLTEGLATYEQGFPEITMTPLENGGIPPSGYDVNGVLNDLSSHIVHLNQGGQYKFDSDLCNSINGYSKGAILLSDDESKQYISLVNNNKVNFNTATPAQISGKWDIFNDKINGSIKAGDGLIGTVENKNSTLSLGTPSTINENSTNTVTASSHTHEVAKATINNAGIVRLHNGLEHSYSDRALTATQGKILNERINNTATGLNNKNGYIKFINGLIIQWFEIKILAKTGSQYFYYPIEFPNNVYNIQYSNISNFNLIVATVAFGIQSINKSSIQIYSYNAGENINQQTIKLNVIVIGN